MYKKIKNSLMNESNWVNFESKLSKIEDGLSKISGYTVVLAPIAGPIKIIMGIVQIVAAGILRSFGSQLKSDAEFAKRLKRHTIEHIKHGYHNIFAGVIESLPIVSSIALLIRNYDCSKPIGGVSYQTDEGIKFLRYESVEKRSMKFVADEYAEPGKLKETEKFFNFAYPDNAARDKATLGQMKKDASLAVQIADYNTNTDYIHYFYPALDKRDEEARTLNVFRSTRNSWCIDDYNYLRGYEAIHLKSDNKGRAKILIRDLERQKLFIKGWVANQLGMERLIPREIVHKILSNV